MMADTFWPNDFEKRLSAALQARDRADKNYNDIRQYNIALEKYLCECISIFAQHDIAPPVPPERIGRMLQERFINAIKGE